MTTTANRYQFPAGIAPDAVLITEAGRAALDQAIFQPVAYQWDVLALTLAGTVLDRAEVIDSHVSLLDACRMATALNHMDRGKGIIYLVQRHPLEEPDRPMEEF
jgi:hypothetical protein